MWPLNDLVGLSLTIYLFCYWPFSISLSNGLASTPPMGWMPWARFMCSIDCKGKNTSADCISESLFVEMADILVSQGYRTAGYNRINLDDCYLDRKRSSSGQLQADPVRFPRGLKWLGDYIHQKRLHFGVYQNLGQTTCMGYPGSLEHLEIDAETFAQWGADMLKLDGCFSDPKIFAEGYAAMLKSLNKTGRPIVFSCSWPFYVRTIAKQEPDYDLIRRTCNMWRNFDDIELNFPSITKIIDFYEKHQDQLSKFHGPNNWNDPDMLIIGNPGVTVDQAKVQFALWCIWSAPLLMSNDLRNIQPEFKSILLNERLIAINQDPFGIMGKLVNTIGNVKIYVKPVTPAFKDASGKLVYSYAIALYNTKKSGKVEIGLQLSQFGLSNRGGYNTQELFSGDILGHFTPSETIKVAVDPMSALMLKATVVVLERMEESPNFSDSQDGHSLPPHSRFLSINSSGTLWLLAVFCLLCFVVFNKRKFWRILRIS